MWLTVMSLPMGIIYFRSVCVAVHYNIFQHGRKSRLVPLALMGEFPDFADMPVSFGQHPDLCLANTWSSVSSVCLRGSLVILMTCKNICLLIGHDITSLYPYTIKPSSMERWCRTCQNGLVSSGSMCQCSEKPSKTQCFNSL